MNTMDENDISTHFSGKTVLIKYTKVTILLKLIKPNSLFVGVENNNISMQLVTITSVHGLLEPSKKQIGRNKWT